MIRYWETNKPDGDGFEPGRPDGDTLPKRFGSFLDAHKNHKWDALVLLPLLTTDFEDELAAMRKFVDYAIEHDSARQIYVFQSWLGRPLLRDEGGKIAGLGDLNYQEIWEADEPGDDRRGPGLLGAVRRDYKAFLDQVNKEYAKQLGGPILVIPFGDIVFELDKQLKQETIPGLEDLYRRDPQRIPTWDPEVGTQAGANILYADRYHPVAQPHLDGTIATYVMGLMYYSILTGKSPIGLSGDAYKLGDKRDEPLRRALQSVVWGCSEKKILTRAYGPKL